MKLNDGKHLPISMYVLCISLDFLLVYHLTEQQARLAVRRDLFSLLNIEDRSCDEDFTVFIMNQGISHSTSRSQNTQSTGRSQEAPLSSTRGPGTPQSLHRRPEIPQEIQHSATLVQKSAQSTIRSVEIPEPTTSSPGIQQSASWNQDMVYSTNRQQDSTESTAWNQTPLSASSLAPHFANSLERTTDVASATNVFPKATNITVSPCKP
jgi:hypothetical protein